MSLYISRCVEPPTQHAVNALVGSGFVHVKGGSRFEVEIHIGQMLCMQNQIARRPDAMHAKPDHWKARCYACKTSPTSSEKWLLRQMTHVCVWYSSVRWFAQLNSC